MNPSEKLICSLCEEDPKIASSEAKCAGFAPFPTTPLICRSCGHEKRHHKAPLPPPKKLNNVELPLFYCISCQEDPQTPEKAKCQQFLNFADPEANPLCCARCGHDKTQHKILDSVVLRSLEVFDELITRQNQQINQQNQEIENLKNIVYQLENLFKDKTQTNQISQNQGNNILNINLNSPLPTLESQIVIENDIKKILFSWIEGKNTSLLFRASRDGFSSSAFHSKCDNKGPTLAIIKDKNGNIFGGFTRVAWSSPFGPSVLIPVCKEDSFAFLFTLKNNQQILPQIFKIKNDEKKFAVFHHNNLGLIFGSGYDLFVPFNTFYQSSTSSSSYENPTGKEYPLTGQYQLDIDDVEVFLVEFVSENLGYQKDFSKSYFI